MVIALVGVAAIVAIVVGRQGGSGNDPPPLPAAPSHLISTVSREHPVNAGLQVGDYLTFALPSGPTYSAVIEQPGTQTPVLEELTAPGQQPQLRADAAGHAVVEVLSAPACAVASGCPDQRTLLGAIDVTVAP